MGLKITMAPIGIATLVALGAAAASSPGGNLAARLRGGPPGAVEAARLALERRGVRVLTEADDASTAAASYAFSRATGLYRLEARPDGSDSAELPAWLGGASMSYEAVAEARGLGFLALPESERERSIERPRYDAAWGEAAEDEEVGVRCSASGYIISPMPHAEVKAAAASLSDAARAVLLRGETERPRSHDATPAGAGVYRCAVGGLPLFSSQARRPSTTGWPSFVEPLDEQHVIYRPDESGGLARTEVLCARSRCHLGHVFHEAGGRRFCINGAALRFDACDTSPRELILAAGCFWGLQHALLRVAGVLDAHAGYAMLELPTSAGSGGALREAAAAARRAVTGWGTPPLPEATLSYDAVRNGSSGWVEAVSVRFNAETAPAALLLDLFFRAHDARSSRVEPWPANYASAILVPSCTPAAAAAELRAAAMDSAARALAGLREVDAAATGGAGAAPPERLATVIGGVSDGIVARFVRAEEAQQRYLAKRGKPLVVRRFAKRGSPSTRARADAAAGVGLGGASRPSPSTS